MLFLLAQVGSSLPAIFDHHHLDEYMVIIMNMTNKMITMKKKCDIAVKVVNKPFQLEAKTKC